MVLHEDIWAEGALDVAATTTTTATTTTATALLVIHNLAPAPNPRFNLLQRARQAATNTVLGGPFTSAACDKEYAKAQFLIRLADREQFRLGTRC